MRLSERDPGWVVGFEDEVWWSRVALPSVRAWSEDGEPSRLLQQSVAKGDPDPKAISCYGLYLPELLGGVGETWLRFVDGRPVSGITTRFLAWCSERLSVQGKEALVLVWDNASWHISKEVRQWMCEHNRQVKKDEKQGTRIISCLLPKQSPWLNPIEPKWMHGKCRVFRTDGLLSARELAERVCTAFGCPHYEHLHIPENAA
jgi:DDE superfamily endonuclease